MLTAIASPYGEYNYCLRALLHPRTGSTMAGQDISVRRITLCRSTYVESHKLINIKGHQSTLTVYNTNGIFNKRHLRTDPHTKEWEQASKLMNNPEKIRIDIKDVGVSIKNNLILT